MFQKTKLTLALFAIVSSISIAQAQSLDNLTKSNTYSFDTDTTVGGSKTATTTSTQNNVVTPVTSTQSATNTSNWVVEQPGAATSSDMSILDKPKQVFTNQNKDMSGWTFTKVECDQIINNLQFKGMADYLPLWNPPTDSIDNTTYTLEPLFTPTDLIYNGVNYGKGGVLLGSTTMINPRTGNVNSVLDKAPVVMNNCNITWVIPQIVIDGINQRTLNDTGDGSGGGYSSEAVKKLNEDAQARAAHAKANGLSYDSSSYMMGGRYNGSSTSGSSYYQFNFR